jgi:hypothetical protein
MRLLLLTFLMLTSCATQSNEAHFEKDANAKIADKRALYCELSEAKFKERGWAVGECDGLLFTALRGIGCGNDVAAFESTVEPGRWYRSPRHDYCFVPDKVGEQGGDSTISKDMYVGLSAILAHTGDREAASRTVEYGDAKNWIVGEARDAITVASKCFIVPQLQNVFRKIAAMQTLAPSDDDALGVSTGFRAHLDVLAILVRGKLYGSISNLDLAILKEQVKRQPRNALYQAAKARYDDGDYNPALEILSDETLFPEKSLPNNHQNYCSDYLFQRDEDDSDWKPCPQNDFSSHDGTDFIFASSIVSGLL